ncbi:MAG TPA: PilZ domain-containing protein [Desulfobacteraceae bacterium]|nr:PilZ domain-containing protein [Desulfobacteraceae bacterium]
MSNTERRRYVRPESLNLLDYIVVDEHGVRGEYSMGRTLNISIGGILMETRSRLRTGQQVMITIGLEDELVDVMGRVVHTAEHHDKTFHNGIEFFHASVEDRRIINRYVEAFHKRYPEAGRQNRQAMSFLEQT